MIKARRDVVITKQKNQNQIENKQSCLRRVRFLEVLHDVRGLEHGDARIWVFDVRHLERPAFVEELLTLRRSAAARPLIVR